MAKVNKTYVCSYCGRDIEYGDEDAVSYCGDIYCNSDCVMDSLDIDYYEWENEYEFDIPEDESNAFGIRYIGEDWFSNGHYAVFDKFDESKFELNKDVEEYFGVKRNGLPDISKYRENFDTFRNLFVTVKIGEVSTFSRKPPNTKSSENTFDKIHDVFVRTDYRKFVCKYISGTENPLELNVFVKDDILYIALNGKRAIICCHRDPIDWPDLYEEEKQCEYLRESSDPRYVAAKKDWYEHKGVGDDDDQD